VIQDVSEAFADCKNNAVPVSTRPKFKIGKIFLKEKLTVIGNSILRKSCGDTKSNSPSFTGDKFSHKYLLCGLLKYI
jgi:hypothetical protein